MAWTNMIEGLTAYKVWKACNGYTLYAMLGNKKVKLMDMNGNTVHKWSLPAPPALKAELLENGNLLFAGHLPQGPMADLEGAGGILLEMDWAGKIVWEYKDPFLHHWFQRLPSGNTLVLKWAPLSAEAAAKVEGGVPQTEREGKMYGDVIEEIDVSGKKVWEWKSWEHLDPGTEYICPLCTRDLRADANSFAVLPDNNLVVSFRRICTLALINRTSGKIDWKWGVHELGHQNCISVLDNGNIMVFDNGFHGEGIHHPYSRIIELDSVSKEMIWDYRDKDNDNVGFYTGFMGSAQRLANGNTIIAESRTGRLFEITRNGEIVWEWVNAECSSFPEYGNSTVITCAFRYGLDYPGLKKLTNLNLGRIIQTEKDIAVNAKAKEERDRQAEGAAQTAKPEGPARKSSVESRLSRLGY